MGFVVVVVSVAVVVVVPVMVDVVLIVVDVVDEAVVVVIVVDVEKSQVLQRTGQSLPSNPHKAKSIDWHSGLSGTPLQLAVVVEIVVVTVVDVVGTHTLQRRGHFVRT